MGQVGEPSTGGFLSHRGTPKTLDGLQGKIPLKWIIFGAVALFQETSNFTFERYELMWFERYIERYIINHTFGTGKHTTFYGDDWEMAYDCFR